MLEWLIGLMVVYLFIGALIALLAYVDGRNGGPGSLKWQPHEWAVAVLLGPLMMVMLFVQGMRHRP